MITPFVEESPGVWRAYQYTEGGRVPDSTSERLRRACRGYETSMARQAAKTKAKGAE